MDKLTKEDQKRAAAIVMQAGITFAGIIVEWTTDDGIVKYGVVPSNLEKSVTDLLFIKRIQKDGKTIVYTKEGDKLIKYIIKVEKLKVIGFNN